MILAVPAAGLAWLGGPPWVANHYGFALPGADGLPYRIHYSGRDYATQGYCADAGWCNGQRRACESQQAIPGASSFAHVADIATVFGPAYPVYSVNTTGFTSVVLFVHVGTCYVPYELEGGP